MPRNTLSYKLANFLAKLNFHRTVGFLQHACRDRAIVIFIVSPTTCSCYCGVAYIDTTVPNALRADISRHHLRVHMAQVTKGQRCTAAQIAATRNYRRHKVRFEILPDGEHEHNLVNIRTEATVADTLRSLIKGKWKKRQTPHVEEVGCN
jgi:hypothetical protein